MASLNLRSLPPWALYGGAGLVAGGGWLLYKRRQAAVSAASPGGAASPTTLDTSQVPAQTDSGQQSSVVPYYLTADQQAQGGPGRRTPLPVGASVPGGSAATGTSGSTGSVLPPIPPILPAPTVPPAPTVQAPAPAAPAPVVVQPAPAPPPSQQVANLPAQLLAQIQANGERIIGSLIDPVTGGTWWFGSKGGVFAVNGARYLGSAANAGFTDPNVRFAVQAVPLGNGYRIVSNRGETYNFNG